MTGYYFHNMDARSTRAHACQIFNTVVAIDSDVSLSLVLPWYQPKVDMNIVKENHGLPVIPQIVFLRNFGIKKSGLAAFALFNLPAVVFIVKKKLARKVDYVYFRTSYFLPLAALVWLLRVPFFYETHRKPVSWSERCRDCAMSKLATGIIVISSYMGEHYLSYKKKMLVAHDAVSLKRFVGVTSKAEAREKLGLLSAENICVYAGTVSKLKGIEYVIVAAGILPKVQFVLAGAVSSEFVNESFPPNVKNLGRVEQNKLPNILQAADVLLLPHPKGEYSQSPMKLFEYMASGVPIVASHLPAISEVLNERNAVLVAPEDGNALARGVMSVISNPHLAQTLAENAYNDVQNYTWEKRGEKIAKFIKETLALKN